MTFKENCPDTRNSKVDDIIKRLSEYEISLIVVNPWASERNAMREYGVALTKLKGVKKLYKNCDDAEKVLIDVKGLYKVSDLEASGMKYWRL